MTSLVIKAGSSVSETVHDNGFKVDLAALRASNPQIKNLDQVQPGTIIEVPDSLRLSAKSLIELTDTQTKGITIPSEPKMATIEYLSLLSKLALEHSPNRANLVAKDDELGVAGMR